MLRVPLLGSNFSPRQLPGLVLWLDASDPSTLFQDSALTTAAVADADPVGGWKDKSSQGNHLLQATAGFRPTLRLAVQNGKNVLRFDGVDDFLARTFTMTQPRTLFIVGKRSAATAAMFFTDGSGSSFSLLITDDSPGLTWRIYAGTTLDSVSNYDQSWHALLGGFNGASSMISVDGVETTGNAGTAVPAGLTIGSKSGGGGNQLNGDIAAVVACSGLLTASARAQLIRYARSMWGTP